MADNKRAIGLDIGERRIGVAISDDAGMLATPYTAIRRRSLAQDITAILEIARAEGVGRIIVGLPLSLNGTTGPQAQLTMSFCETLKAATPLPVETWDERFSTAEAEQRLREAGVPPSYHRDRVDASAAAVVLQSYLDTRRRIKA